MYSNFVFISEVLIGHKIGHLCGQFHLKAKSCFRFGYVPNGCRVYLLDRSQPPLLGSMVDDYISATGDNQFLEEVLPALEQEYVFWTEYRGVNITKNGETFKLQRYQGSASTPR